MPEEMTLDEFVEFIRNSIDAFKATIDSGTYPDLVGIKMNYADWFEQFESFDE